MLGVSISVNKDNEHIQVTCLVFVMCALVNSFCKSSLKFFSENSKKGLFRAKLGFRYVQLQIF